MTYKRDKLAYCRKCRKETRQVWTEETRKWKCDDCEEKGKNKKV